MANKRISQITNTVTVLRSGDVMELDNAGLSTATASAQIAVGNVTAGRLIAYGWATLSSALTLALQSISYGATLPEVPDHVEIQFFKLAAAPDIPIGIVNVDSITALGFDIQMIGTLSDNTSYSVKWKAYSANT